ncbi:MAG: hypothetical protein JWO13_794 [Acidobacteriales bacterium]|nr:hypothetical protein [Terriglobales bacterium]
MPNESNGNSPLDPKLLELGAAFAKQLIEGKVDYETALRIFKKQLTDAALEAHNGCKQAAGKGLGISRNYVRTLARLKE